MNNCIEKFILRFEIQLYLVLYFISNILLVINNSVYWDGWTLFNTKPEILHEQFVMNGNVVFGYIYQFLFSFEGHILCRVGTFLSFLVSGLLMYKLLTRIREVQNIERFFIVALFMILPLNYARISSINFTYSLTYLSFFAGWWFLSKSLTQYSWGYRLLALLLFLFSFLTNSFLFFYILPLAYILYNSTNLKRNYLNLIKKHIDFIMLPIFFFFIKIFFLKPVGLYAQEGYNEIGILNVLSSPIAYLITLKESLIRPFISNNFVVLFIIISCLILIIKRNVISDDNTQKKIKFNYLFFSGLIIAFLGVFPYLAVGKLPKFFEWSSRHQMLTPLGISLIFVGVLSFWSKLMKFRNLFLILIITSSVLLNVNTYYMFLVDGIKQDSLIENFKADKIIANSNILEFEDHTNEYNAIRRKYRFYEYTGLLKYSFANTKHLGLNFKSQLNFQDLEKMQVFPHYSFQDANLDGDRLLVRISKGKLDLSFFNVLELLHLKFFSKQEYLSRVKDVIYFTINKIESPVQNI